MKPRLPLSALAENYSVDTLSSTKAEKRRVLGAGRSKVRRTLRLTLQGGIGKGNRTPKVRSAQATKKEPSILSWRASGDLFIASLRCIAQVHNRRFAVRSFRRGGWRQQNSGQWSTSDLPPPMFQYRSHCARAVAHTLKLALREEAGVVPWKRNRT